jgi:nitrate/nitrite transporter NarK
MGFFFLTMLPAVYSMIGRYAPSHLLGTASGVYSTISGLGSIIVTIGFRLIKDAVGWKIATASLVTALLVLSLLVFLVPETSGSFPPQFPAEFEP